MPWIIQPGPLAARLGHVSTDRIAGAVRVNLGRAHLAASASLTALAGYAFQACSIGHADISPL